MSRPGMPGRISCMTNACSSIWRTSTRTGATFTPPRCRSNAATGSEGPETRCSFASKAPASFRGAKPENPLEPRYRALRVAAEEIIVPGHLDDVGDVNQASDDSERKAARDRERDPIRQAAFRPRRSATTDETEKLS